MGSKYWGRVGLEGLGRRVWAENRTGESRDTEVGTAACRSTEGAWGAQRHGVRRECRKCGEDLGVETRAVPRRAERVQGRE